MRHWLLLRGAMMAAVIVAWSCAVLAVPGWSAVGVGAVRYAGAPGAATNRYIVVLKDPATSTVDATQARLARTYGGQVQASYRHAVHGFAATLSATAARRLAGDPAVRYVEQDRRVRLAGTEVAPPSWGLDRIDQPGLPLSNLYTYPSTASGVHAYIIDTGVRISHGDFGGRASYGYDFVDDDPVADDCAGHGTHVAGTVGGTRYGVAKGIQLVSVRVLDCDGFGWYSTIIAGVDWVTAHAVKPAVATMSLGGPADDALDAAVQQSIDSGVTYAVAAGNDNTDACTVSPARVPGAITAAATDATDTRAEFSNYGSCVDLFAPGVRITSTFDTSDTATAVFSGTSMAAPHVAGVAALVLAQHPAYTPAQVAAALVAGAARGVVRDAAGSPNELLNVDNGAPSVVRLRARVNGRYVTAESAGAQSLIANRVTVGNWERFDRIDLGGGYIALRAHANGRYVTAEAAGAAPLVANRTAVGGWEEFQVVPELDGSVSLRAAANGRYVTAESGGRLPLIANRSGVGLWEEFDLTDDSALQSQPAVTAVSLRARVNGRYVTAEAAGAQPLIANRAAVGGWERFDRVDLGGGYIALRAYANGRYVTAESAGARPLIANRTAVGGWEEFQVVTNLDGSVSLRAAANGRYVTAENAGRLPLIANRSGIGLWEEFDFVS